jgi:hypothetical protein
MRLGVDGADARLHHKFTVDVLLIDELAESLEIGQFEAANIRAVWVLEEDRLAMPTILERRQ